MLQFTVQGLEPGQSVSRLLAEQLRRMTEQGTPVPKDEAADDDLAGKDLCLIDLDATNWRSILDFYAALLTALRAPEWHGSSVDALVNSMIWGGINEIEPPYTVRVFGISKVSQDIREEIEAVKQALIRAHADIAIGRLMISKSISKHILDWRGNRRETCVSSTSTHPIGRQTWIFTETSSSHRRAKMAWHKCRRSHRLDGLGWGQRSSPPLHSAHLRNGKIAQGRARSCRTGKAPPYGSLCLFS